MTGELLFHVSGSTAVAAEAISLADVGLRERSDLQEWVLQHPLMLGDGVRIVTFEFDQWNAARDGAPRDRLDVLGLDEDGRLVIAELKRDVAPDTIYSQAIKYAAMASRFDEQTLADQHARHLTRQGVATTPDAARSLLLEHAPDLSESTLRRPRIVLLARDFPAQVTAAAVWLNEMGLDLTLMRFQAYRAADKLLLTVSQLFPVPDVEEFTVAPQRAEARNAESPVRAGSREITATRRLAEADAIEDGTVFTLRPQRLSGSARAGLEAWLAEDIRRGTAVWRNDPVKPLVWDLDHDAYTAGGLAKTILTASIGDVRTVEGTRWWVDPEGFDLVELAQPLAGERAPLYLDFWTAFLEAVTARHLEWQPPEASRRSWIRLPSTYTGAHWGVSFAAGSRLRSELYVRGDRAADQRYAELAPRAGAVDAAYGSPLSWEPLPTRKSSRVAAYRSASIDRVEEFEQYVEWAIDSQERLRAAIAQQAPFVAWLDSASGT